MNANNGGMAVAVAENSASAHELRRSLSWVDVFFVASGVPALVLFSVGALADQVGTPSCLVWLASVMMGFSQAFTYAEISGLFPDKAGGASVYGSIAWLPYSKFIAPLSVWCNWIAWTPILSIGTCLIAGYILTSFFAPDAAVMTWQYVIADVGWLRDGLTIRLNATFFLGAAILIGIFTAQYFGISKAAKIIIMLSLTGLLPLTVVSLVPLISGDVVMSNLTPFVPQSGAWDMEGIGVFLGGMYVAAWTTYAFETCVCYTREFKDPQQDVIKSLVRSGILCIVMFALVPFAFVGALGVAGVSRPDIVDGSGVGMALANLVHGGPIITMAIIMMLILAISLAVMTSMAGSSRTLYQASVDGWLPRYLSHVNSHGSPTFAMCTDLVFNLMLLMMSDYMVVILASTCGYIIFNFLNLQSGWIHRLDSSHIKRAFRAPNWLLGLNSCLGFVNLSFMGVAMAELGFNNIITGLLICLLIIPVFIFRHYVQDHGVFPTSTAEASDADEERTKHAGILPYMALAAGAFTVLGCYKLFS